MADDAAKAEKLAAAKKRVEALKKKKGGKKEKKDKPASEVVEKEPEAAEEVEEAEKEEAEKEEAEKAEKEDAAKEEAEKTEKTEEAEKAEAKEADSPTTSPSLTVATPSLSEQSRLRSASFRHGGPLSPGTAGSGTGSGTGEGETAADIYRKQAARIEELERQAKRLTKEAADAEKRWQSAEDALADAREGGEAGEVAKLAAEVAALKRQNAQLQTRRHGSSPSMSVGASPGSAGSEFDAQLQAKASTIATMEMEMSRLRAQVERLSMSSEGGTGSTGGTESAGTHGLPEQVLALEEKLARAEKAAGSAQRELAEVKRNLDRASEKAVREGSARTSAETKARALEQEVADVACERDALAKKAEALEMKVATLTTLHKEHDARTQALRRDKEALETKLAHAEAEALALQKRAAADAGGTDDERLDELLAASPDSDARAAALDARVRALEAENADLRSGLWHERRKAMQVGPDGDAGDGVAGAGRHFSDVDLSPAGKRGGGAGGSGGAGGTGGAGGPLGGFFSALTGTGTNDHGVHARGPSVSTEGFLDDDDDLDFDEEAFRRAHEEEARLRIERVKETKRALKNWEGWRLDLVESRQGGVEGIGPIFEI